MIPPENILIYFKNIYKEEGETTKDFLVVQQRG